MEHLQKNLKTAIFKVMEQMFFLLHDDEDASSLGEEPETVYIGISGNPSYLLTLTFDRQLARSMTCDLLGVEEDEADTEMIKKSLRETANIMGGNFLLSFPEDEQRNVTLPTCDINEIFPGCRTKDAETVMLSFDGRGMTATVATVE